MFMEFVKFSTLEIHTSFFESGPDYRTLEALDGLRIFKLYSLVPPMQPTLEVPVEGEHGLI